MAPKRVLSYLVCFYCGSKSRHLQDGLVRRWECGSCDAMNYLDEKGQIRDPPVHTLGEAPPVMYAQPVSRETSPFSSTSSTVPFCSKCLHNQHMYATSIAQYSEHFSDEDPIDLRSANLERTRIKEIERTVRERYPLYCDDCAPRAQQHLDRAIYTAKADHLRRTLDRTRANGGPGKTRPWTWADVITLLGKTMWWSGLVGQMLWNFTGLLLAVAPNVLKTCGTAVDSSDAAIKSDSGFCRVVTYLVDEAPTLLSILHNTSAHHLPRLAKWSFMSSLFSSWWNPHIKANSRGFRAHIVGTRNWYEFQVIWIIGRAIFWFVMGHGVFSTVDAPATKGAHALMLLFSILIVNLAPRSVKADLNQLFAPSPNTLLEKSQGKKANNSSNERLAYPSISLGQAIHEIDEEQRQKPFSEVAFSSSVAPPNTRPQFLDQWSGSSSYPFVQQSRQEFPNPSAGPDEPSQQLQLQMTHVEDMEWTPTHSEHRAFSPVQRPFGAPDRFNQAPVEPKSSTFWYPVPPAPTTPAQRLRNPPNKPQLVGRSQEVKENFFKRPTPASQNAAQAGSDESREYLFAQPKFFPPAQPDSDTLITGFMEAFSNRLTLDSAAPEPSSAEGTTAQSESQPREGKGERANYVKALAMTVVLVAAVSLWAEYYRKAVVLGFGTVAVFTLTAVYI